MLLNDEKKKSLAQKFRDFMVGKLQNATGRIRGRVVGNGPAEDVKKARDALPLFLRVVGMLPMFDPSMKPRPLHARKIHRAGVDRKDMYRDVDGNWQPFPKQLQLHSRARKLGFHGSWRSPSLKPSHALKREHAARVRAKLEEA